ncbi:DUF805 domain-containing protein [Ningiella sp. W23]|uniref:DUF805 domain-containing protein n=1 Tax=Ningiella sp. W23 TaxID=3023715 RepID=UPI0039F4634E
MFAIIAGLIFGFGGVTSSEVDSGISMSQVMIFIVYLFMLIGFVFVGIRRLHDIDKSAWYYLIMFIPLVNIIFGLYILFARGTQGSNNYGPQPLPNHIGLWIAGLILPIVFVIGVLAAIALPAYQAYEEKVEQGLYQ